MAIKSVTQREKEYLKTHKKDYEKDIKENDKIYDKQKKTVEDIYGNQIVDTKKSYENAYRENAVQKLVNERKIAENMANSGITDSGLNRTQQSAVQLSYANQRGEIDIKRQAAVDALAQELSSRVSTIEQNRISTNAQIKSNYEANARNAAIESYNADVQAATDRYKAQQQQIAASNKAYYSAMQKMNDSSTEQISIESNSFLDSDDKLPLSYGYSGTLATQGIRVVYDGNITRYIDDKTGKTIECKRGENPYTRTINKDLLNDKGEYDTKNAFSNGYQPNNIGGVPLKWNGEDTMDMPNGRTQRVFTENGKYWLWNGGINDYVRLTKVYDEKTGKVGWKLYEE